MNGSTGMAELLLDTSLRPDQGAYLTMLQRSADALLGLLNGVLDLSKIEAGRLEVAEVPFDLREVVDTAADLVATRAHVKGLELICRIEPDVPTGLVGDSMRLQQVLVNLLGNAIKFTDAGQVILNVSCEQRDTPHAELRVSVSGTGIGIPPDQEVLGPGGGRGGRWSQRAGQDVPAIVPAPPGGDAHAGDGRIGTGPASTRRPGS